MASSGTSTFDLDLRDIIEEAYEMCGLTARSGSDYRSARRSLDLLFTEWSTRGINFWTLEEASTSVAAGTATVTLDSDVLDVLEVYTRTNVGSTNQQDQHVKRIGVKDWANLPTKLSQGRPVNVWVEKLKAAPVLHLWPVPDQTYTLVVHQLTRIEDTGTPGTNTADVPWNFVPAMTAGLAAKIALKRAPDRLGLLTDLYERTWLDAESSNRERRSTHFSPNLNPYRR